MSLTSVNSIVSFVLLFPLKDSFANPSGWKAGEPVCALKQVLDKPQVPWAAASSPHWKCYNFRVLNTASN